jgi:putative endonuclease
MKTSKQYLGIYGERLAAEFLQHKGYIILEKNFNVHHIGEIDLIAQKNDEIVFIEVKTRTSEHYGYPEEAVNDWKIKKISRCARNFLHTRNLHTVYARFDIISVIIDEKTNNTTIKHIPNISISLDY